MSVFDPYYSSFQSASQQTGVPVPILEAVGYTESGFNPSALGSSGEIGVMQLMPGIAQTFGVSNPYDANSNILGGAQLLAQDYGRTGDWLSALSMYNSGSATGSPTYANKVMSLAQQLGFGGASPAATTNGAGGASTNGTSNTVAGSITDTVTKWLDGIAGSVTWVVIGLLIFGVGLFILAKDSGVTDHIPIPVEA